MKKELFKFIDPYENGFLQVSDLHSIYWEKSGNPEGKPILIIHGGPGGGSQPRYRRYFDPNKFNIIQFDQRGCGKSLPHSELKENTTQNLVNDIEKLRVRLKINSWHLFGGSWGATLSLIYAIQHKERVLSLTLRGIFLCRNFELQWFYQKGASEIFPEEFEKYKSIIPASEQDQLIKAYYLRLTTNNKEERRKAAISWTRWEMATSHLIQKELNINKASNYNFSDAFARIESHYFINNIFLKENYILDNIHLIKAIPTTIVQGRYDIVCPARSAWDLSKKLDNCKLIIVNEAGHSMSEEGITKELLKATNNIL